MHRRIAPILSLLAVLAACPPSEVGESPDWTGAELQEVVVDTDISVIETHYVEPVSVGFEFDGVVEFDGTLSGYFYEDEYYEPLMFLHFVSNDFFTSSSEEIETVEGCLAWGVWDVEPSDTPLDTYNDVEPWFSYEGFLDIEDHDCHGLFDPAVWGTDGADLIEQFDGMHLGVGFAPLHPSLEETWSQELLSAYGDSMVSNYVAMNWLDGTFEAEEFSTGFCWEWDWWTEELAFDTDGNLVPQPVDAFGLPESYVFSVAYWYADLAALDLETLKEDR